MYFLTAVFGRIQISLRCLLTELGGLAEVSSTCGVWGLSKRDGIYRACISYNTFYPFQNKHQIHRHLQSFKMMCAFKKSKFCVSLGGLALGLSMRGCAIFWSTVVCPRLGQQKFHCNLDPLLPSREVVQTKIF